MEIFRRYEEIDMLIRTRMGIKLTEIMAYRLKNDLHSVVKDADMEAYLIRVLNSPYVTNELKELYSLITVNETYFFRDETHYDILEWVVIPVLISRKINDRNRVLNVWSAGCSSGEEPYSTAMTLQATLPFDFSYRIFATDIDKNALAKAQTGVYDRNSIRNNVLVSKHTKYFDIVDEQHVQVAADIKQKVTFMYANLKDNIFLSGLDIVFFRNVLIYFDDKMKSDMIKKINSILNPGGFLFLGVGEGGILMNHSNFEMHSELGGIYWQKK